MELTCFSLLRMSSTDCSSSAIVGGGKEQLLYREELSNTKYINIHVNNSMQSMKKNNIHCTYMFYKQTYFFLPSHNLFHQTFQGWVILPASQSWKKKSNLYQSGSNLLMTKYLCGCKHNVYREIFVPVFIFIPFALVVSRQI